MYDFEKFIINKKNYTNEAWIDKMLTFFGASTLETPVASLVLFSYVQMHRKTYSKLVIISVVFIHYLIRIESKHFHFMRGEWT